MDCPFKPLKLFCFLNLKSDHYVVTKKYISGSMLNEDLKVISFFTLVHSGWTIHMCCVSRFHWQVVKLTCYIQYTDNYLLRLITTALLANSLEKKQKPQNGIFRCLQFGVVKVFLSLKVDQLFFSRRLVYIRMNPKMWNL